MKTFSFDEILKIIPFEEVFRTDLLKRLENADVDEQVEIKKTCWSAFWELNKELVQIKFNEIMKSISKQEKKYHLGGEIMKRAQKEVWMDLENMLNGKFQETIQMEEIRSKLKSLSNIVENKQTS